MGMDLMREWFINLKPAIEYLTLFISYDSEQWF